MSTPTSLRSPSAPPSSRSASFAASPRSTQDDASFKILTPSFRPHNEPEPRIRIPTRFEREWERQFVRSLRASRVPLPGNKSSIGLRRDEDPVITELREKFRPYDRKHSRSHAAALAKISRTVTPPRRVRVALEVPKSDSVNRPVSSKEMILLGDGFVPREEQFSPTALKRRPDSASGPGGRTEYPRKLEWDESALLFPDSPIGERQRRLHRRNSLNGLLGEDALDLSNRKSHEKRSKSINVRSETNDDDNSDSFRSPSTEVYRTHEKRILSSPAAKLIFGSELTESSPASSKKYPTFRGSIRDPNSSETTSLTEESEILKSGGKKRFNHILNRGSTSVEAYNQQIMNPNSPEDRSSRPQVIDASISSMLSDEFKRIPLGNRGPERRALVETAAQNPTSPASDSTEVFSSV